MSKVRKTKIVCTYGPSVQEISQLKKLIEAGANVIRFNFSHGDHSFHTKGMADVRKIREELSKPVGILLDTKGPEVRTGLQDQEVLQLIRGQKIELTSESCKNSEKLLHINDLNFVKKMNIGIDVLINDGEVRLRIDSKNNNRLQCSIERGGDIKERRGVNVPGQSLGLPFLSDQDKSDLRFGAEQKVDFVAASFCRNSEDIRNLRKYLYEECHFSCDIIAKIENHEGVEDLEAICKESNGIMVARGDLGVELPLEQVPTIQKKIIKICRSQGKPVITATQMLESMIEHSQPTRAEVSDVANAIYDGTSAVMLSGETAAGKYPIECVQMMNTIAREVEEDVPEKLPEEIASRHSGEITRSIALAAWHTAKGMKAQAFVSLTTAGYSARMLSRLRSPIEIIAATREFRTYSKMSLYWGVQPLLLKGSPRTLNELFEVALSRITIDQLLPQGSLVVLLGGSPIGKSASTNLLKVDSVGHVVARGEPMFTGRKRGKVSQYKPNSVFPKKSILVMQYFLKERTEDFKNSSGLILQSSRGADLALEVAKKYEIPFICEAEGVCETLFDGQEILIDGGEGVAYGQTGSSSLR